MWKGPSGQLVPGATGKTDRTNIQTNGHQHMNLEEPYVERSIWTAGTRGHR